MLWTFIFPVLAALFAYAQGQPGVQHKKQNNFAPLMSLTRAYVRSGYGLAGSMIPYAGSRVLP